METNRFAKAIGIKKGQVNNDNSNINEILIENINVKSNENINVRLSDKSSKLKAELKSLENSKTQITINLKNKNLEKLDILAKEIGKSRAYIVDYLLENYL